MGLVIVRLMLISPISIRGVSERLRVKTFNVMPGASRELNIQFPGNLEKGHYSAMMVLDFGSDEELEAAEFEFDKD